MIDTTTNPSIKYITLPLNGGLIKHAYFLSEASSYYVG